MPHSGHACVGEFPLLTQYGYRDGLVFYVGGARPWKPRPTRRYTCDMDRQRLADLKRFYDLTAELDQRIGGTRTLANCNGRQEWPARGVYFFMEEGEIRSNSGAGQRIVRVGTHALKAGSETRLWTRLSQHRGQISSGGGNHRGSIFRLIVGTALITKQGYDQGTWDDRRSTASAAVRAGELALERAVSRVIGAMRFLWLPVNDEPGPRSMRGTIERNVIALLSNYGKEPLDPPSAAWLGRYCTRERVRASGLWNANHVDERYDPAFLDRFDEIVHRVGVVR